jgi:transposase
MLIGLAHGLKVYVCTQPADMRKSFDGLCGLIANLLKSDPQSGHLFLFRNRNRDRLKILYWDRDGLAIWYKRLEQGTFQFPTDLTPRERPTVSVEITVSQLSLLLGGIDLRSVRERKRFTPPNQPR